MKFKYMRDIIKPIHATRGLGRKSCPVSQWKRIQGTLARASTAESSSVVFVDAKGIFIPGECFQKES